jgi:hypothetical protein
MAYRESKQNNDHSEYILTYKRVKRVRDYTDQTDYADISGRIAANANRERFARNPMPPKHGSQ